MRFTKMNGAGNDFIIVENLRGELDEQKLSKLARTLCDRRMSIGADGLMAVVPAKGTADYGMLFFNCDGSLGEMCGNGARCICRYGYEHGLAGETQRVETTAGLVTGTRIDKRYYRIRLNDPTTVKLDYPVESGGRTYAGSYVELGNPGLPHAVIPMSGLAALQSRDLFDLGRALRYHPAYPKGANVNFYELTGPDTVLEKTYERGVEDFTLACGTGTGAVVTVLTLLGKVSGRNVRVRMDGGELAVDAEAHDGRIENLYLTGPAALVCAGEILDKTILDLIKKQEEKA